MYKKSLIPLALVAVTSFAAAQQVTINSDGRPDRMFRPAKGLDNEDSRFVRQALTANQFELELSKLGMQNGNSEFTKQFSKEMAMDHKAAQDEAKQTAEERGLSTDIALPQPLQARINHLSRLHGDAFDQEFCATQKMGHEQTIQAYKNEIENGRDEDVKAMAVKELPTVELHYKMILNKKTMMGDTAAGHGM
jgi:putative membrane protein